MNRSNDELKWVGVDLDKTLADSGFPDFTLQEPLPGAKEAMDTLVERGFKPIIYTARPWIDYEKIETWLNKNSIPFSRIVCGKLMVKYMIDDRNVEFNGDWGEVLKKIT